MAAGSPSAADRIARFAELVDAVDVEGVQIVGYDTDRLTNSGDLQGSIDLRIGDVRADDETAESGLEDGEQHAMRPTGSQPHPVDEMEACEVDHGGLPGGEQCPGCDYTAPLPGPGFEPGDSEDEDEAPDDPLIEEIVSILEAEGEVRSSDLRDRVDGNQTEFYDAADELKATDRLSVRDDPDDGRRKLYSLVDEDDQEDGPVWNGENPETIVADSSLPARVVLDDILDAAASASTVIEVAEALDVDVNNLEPVAWQLTLKKPDSLEIVDGVEERTDLIREVAA